MKYQVTLPNFEGPLDLLLHLVKKAEVDIYEVSMSDITDQYMAYIESWEKFNLEIASEFLVMAAKLMELKSRELLPRNENVDAKEEDENDEDEIKQDLLQKLAEYRFFKEISNYLQEKEKERMQVYWKEQESFLPGTEDKTPPGSGSLPELVYAFQQVLTYFEKKEKVKTIDMDNVSIEKQKEVVIKQIKQQTDQTLQFMELFNRKKPRIIIIVTFLALLDLVKSGKISITQQNRGSPIWLTLNASHDDITPKSHTYTN